MNWAALLATVGGAELFVIAGVAIGCGVLAVSRGAWWTVGVVVCFAAAAVLTPPDLVSALMVAVPLSLAYWWMYKPRRRSAVQETG